MREERSRILEMLSMGEITTEEAERLLRATEVRRISVWTWLFRPMERLDTGKALSISLFVALNQLALSRFEIRFDGAIDLHPSPAPIPWSTAAVDLLLSWPLVALVLWVGSRLVARQGRFVDFLAAVGLARAPFVASGLLAAAFLPGADTAATELTLSVMVSSIGIVLLLVWFFALLVTGTRTASGLRGAKFVATFITAVLAAEILSKTFLFLLK